MDTMFRPRCFNDLKTVAPRVANPFYSLCISFAVENGVYSVLGVVWGGVGGKKAEFFCPRFTSSFLSTIGELFTSQQSCAEWVKTA